MSRISIVRILLFCLATSCPVSLRALPVTGLYSHEIAVNNQSEGERQRAFREALSAVVVKVTGEIRWLENYTVQQAVGNARNYVEAIEFRSATLRVPDPGVVPDDGVPVPMRTVEQEFISVSFARDLVDRLLADAAIPVWDSNRPSVLVWMALQNEAGERRLLSPDTNPEIIELMQQFARERGIPVIFPVLDFEDRRTLNADQVWSLEEDAIRQASQRYAADSILSGRLHFTATGELVGLWQFLFQDSVEVFDSLDTELRSYIYAPMDRITGRLARHFAVAPSLDGLVTARIRVEGISSLSSYANLVDYLQGLVLVNSVAVSRLQGSVLELELSLQGNAQQLFELLTLDRNMVPVERSGLESQPALSYRWIR